MAVRKSVFSIVAFKTVTAAGTGEAAVAASEYADSIVFENPENQSGLIYIADTKAKSETTTRHTLKPGERMEVAGNDMGSGDLEPFDLADFFVNSSVSGEGVVISKITRSGNISEQI